jgi:DNA-binding XRE family transcriptional regulator
MCLIRPRPGFLRVVGDERFLPGDGNVSAPCLGDVRRVRDLLGMSQVVFARFLGVDPNTVRSWEQGTRPPSSIARRFMGEIEEDPAYWRQRVARKVVD